MSREVFYFDHLYDAIEMKREDCTPEQCERLCMILHSILIEPELLDETRLEDISFARTNYRELVDYGVVSCDGESYSELLSDLYRSKPSVFELLATLALKIEEKVMSNPIYGYRAPVWFWTMIENLDISPETVTMPDGRMDVEYIDSVCIRWLDKQFQKNGDGSPFPLRNPPEDARLVDMWRLAMWYFNENFEGKW